MPVPVASEHDKQIAMISSTGNISASHTQSDAFASWKDLSSTVGRINKSLNFINRDPEAKSVNIDLSSNERNLLFSSGQGVVGRKLLDTTLIVSAGREYQSNKSSLINTHYSVTHPSSSNSRLNVYHESGYKLSERVDTLV